MTMCRPLQPPDLWVGERVSDFTAADGWIHALAVCSTNMSRYAFISDEKVVAEWELSPETGAAVKRAIYVGHDHRVTSVRVGPAADGSLFTGCWDNFIRVFKRPFYGELPPPDEPVQLQPVLSLYHPGVFVLSLELLDSHVYSGCGDGKVWQWDLSENPGRSLERDRRVRMSSERVPAEVPLIERSHSATEQSIAQWEAHDGPIVTMCAKHKLLYTGSEDMSVRWWDISCGSCIGQLQMDGPVVSLSAGPTQLLVAVGKTIHVYDLKEMAPTFKIHAHYAGVKVVLAAANGSIYSGGIDRTVRLFSEQGVEQVRYRGHDDPISCLALCEGWLLSCAQDHKCIIWLDDSRVGVDHLPNQRLDNVVSEPLSSSNYFNDRTSSPIPRQP